MSKSSNPRMRRCIMVILSVALQIGYGASATAMVPGALADSALDSDDSSDIGGSSYVATSSGAGMLRTPTGSSAGVTATLKRVTSSPAMPADDGAPVAGYVLKFRDEFNTFNGGSAGTNGWMTVFPEGGRVHGGSSEAEYYSDSSVGANPFSIVNGTLQISATESRGPRGNQVGLPYDSGIITSFKSFHMQYGYFEVRAKMPHGAGLWPAFWLLPEGGAWPPEIDVMEQIGNPNAIYQTIHYVLDGDHAQKGTSVFVADTAAGFHSYAVDWEPAAITTYVDGHQTASWPTPPDMKQPMYILINLAVGGAGSWPGPPDGSTIFPANMYIDYVRAYASPYSVKIGGSLSCGSSCD